MDRRNNTQHLHSTRAVPGAAPSTSYVHIYVQFLQRFHGGSTVIVSTLERRKWRCSGGCMTCPRPHGKRLAELGAGPTTGPCAHTHLGLSCPEASTQLTSQLPCLAGGDRTRCRGRLWGVLDSGETQRWWAGPHRHRDRALPLTPALGGQFPRERLKGKQSLPPAVALTNGQRETRCQASGDRQRDVCLAFTHRYKDTYKTQGQVGH